MIKLSYQMNITHGGDDYQLLLDVERRYGREPLPGELVFVDRDSTPLAVRVLSISWFPDHCSVAVEPAHGVTPGAPFPSSPLEEIKWYVQAGFRCPWTGYPEAMVAPVE